MISRTFYQKVDLGINLNSSICQNISTIWTLYSCARGLLIRDIATLNCAKFKNVQLPIDAKFLHTRLGFFRAGMRMLNENSKIDSGDSRYLKFLVHSARLPSPCVKETRVRLYGNHFTIQNTNLSSLTSHKNFTGSQLRLFQIL